MSIITDINYLKLSEEQKSVFEKIVEGKNIFLTGGAGTGKSFLIQNIKNHLPTIKAARQYPEWGAQNGDVSDGITRTIHLTESAVRGVTQNTTFCPKLCRVRVTALTGCAAILLGSGAKTLHSWAGIGKGQGTIQELSTKIRRGRAYRNWLTTDLLIIDEISMLTSELLEKLDALAKRLRVSCEPFGGIQVVFVGDFFQLPPVIRDLGSAAGATAVSRQPFAFQSSVWASLFKPENEIQLKQIHRQTDQTFQDLLSQARYGKISTVSEEIIRSRMGLDWKRSKIRPTLLFPRRVEVDMINENNLRALKGQKHTYKVDLSFGDKFPIGLFNRASPPPEFIRSVEIMDRDAPYLPELTIAEGAQVMLVYNLDLDRGLSNGSRGVVVGFDEQAGNIPIVEFKNNIRIPVGRQSWEIEDYDGIFRTQIPLRLAYACTIHKAQGSSIDCVLIDIGASTFEYGQAYVALSRARTLEGLYIHDFAPSAIRAHPDVIARFSS